MAIRRLVPSLALLLALVVGGQVTDLVPCADEGCGAWGLVLDAHGGEGDHAPSEEGVGSDCLCHLAFASAPPFRPPAAAETRAAFAILAPAAPPEVGLRVPYPPPRA